MFLKHCFECLLKYSFLGLRGRALFIIFEEYPHPGINIFFLSNPGMQIWKQLATDISPEQLMPGEKYKTSQIDIFDFIDQSDYFA